MGSEVYLCYEEGLNKAHNPVTLTENLAVIGYGSPPLYSSCVLVVAFV